LKCIICDSTKFEEIHLYLTPDKYEKYMGIKDVDRDWSRCLDCGHYQQSRNYPLAELEKIYEDGYRNFNFRGETIKQTYNKVVGNHNNENKQRCEWFIDNIGEWFIDNIGEVRTILDFGSGLGVFPEFLANRGYSVDCVEANKYSQEFIEFDLKIPCYDSMSAEKYDVITLVHVLEHIEKPLDFLTLLNTDKVFIEVPDAIEFELLDKNNDEFNSCHCHFFTRDNLETLLKTSGYKVIAEDDMYYKERNLSRILMIAAKQ